jgi:glutathionylspermidine amidase/synthetase
MNYGILLAGSIITLLVLISVYSEIPKPFGTPLGTSNGITAYSSYNSPTHQRPNFQQNQFTGMQWQCVEFVRRYLIARHGITFQDVQNAYELYSLQQFLLVESTNPVSVQAIPNGSRKPKAESLLVYSKEIDGTGHVAVIVHIGDDYIVVAEQGWDNLHHERIIPCTSSGESYTIHDNYLLGTLEIA